MDEWRWIVWDSTTDAAGIRLSRSAKSFWDNPGPKLQPVQPQWTYERDGCSGGCCYNQQRGLGQFQPAATTATTAQSQNAVDDQQRNSKPFHGCPTAAFQWHLLQPVPVRVLAASARSSYDRDMSVTRLSIANDR